MTPEIRQLHEDIRSKATAAEELLKGDSVSPEDQSKAEALLDETTKLEERRDLLVKADRLKRNGLDALKEEETEKREALRKRAQAAAKRPAADPEARAVEPTTEGEGEARTTGGEHTVTSEDVTGWQRFMSEFGGLLGELRERRTPKQEARRLAFRRSLIWGYGSLPDEQRKLLKTRKAGKPEREEQRAMGLGNAASLGVLVPPETMEEIRLATLAFGGFRSTRTSFLPTATGRAIPIPTVDDTSNQGSYRGEHNALAAATDVAAEPNELNAYYLSSGIMKVSWELAQDESFGLESFLTNLGATRNERRYQLALTTGTGNNQPKGITVGLTSGKTADNTNKFVPQDWYDFFESIDSSYHANLEVMLSNNALTKLKTMQGGIGQGLWQPGLAAGTPSMIDGHPYVVNYHMATVASGNVPVLAGDLSWMYAREVVPPFFLRLQERYADNGQIGFILGTRNDGRLVNPGVVPVKGMTMA